MTGEDIAAGRSALGIELGSTRIKACLIGQDGATLATGSSTWENQLVQGRWTYSLEAVHGGLSQAYADLAARTQEQFGIRPKTFAAIGVSAMMHGYLAFDAEGQLLVPFRTWRNTSTAASSSALTAEFGENIPLRWSVAHLYQAMLDREPHVPQIRSVTTLAGYVHRLLTSDHVLGVGDASGMFPIDPETGYYDAEKLRRFDELAAAEGYEITISDLLPRVASAGEEAGRLSAAGAALLDPTGTLESGVLLCPPEGDAGTGMVATNSIRPRTGNVSVGTSIFSMIVLEKPLQKIHPEIDLVSTPAGHPVAMVHCNNGASELAAWVDLFAELLAELGLQSSPDALYTAVLNRALSPEAQDDGLLSYNLLSGEPILGTEGGRPMIVRHPRSQLTLASFARSQLFGIFATLSRGMEQLREEDVAVDTMCAHGGLFRSRGVAQRALSAAIGTPVAVQQSAGEGGAWGMAALAAYSHAVSTGKAEAAALAQWLEQHMFAAQHAETVTATASEVEAYARFLSSWSQGLPVEHAAIASLP